MRRWISFILSLCILLSFVSVWQVSAEAATPEAAPQVTSLQWSGTASNHNHNDGTWTKWTSTTSLPASGKYYLADTVTPAGRTTLTGDLTLCLCGHTVNTPSNNERMFRVTENSDLTVCDCTAAYDAQGNLTGGKLMGGTAKGSVVWFSPVSTSPASNIQIVLDRVTVDGNRTAVTNPNGGVAVWTDNAKCQITMTDCVIKNCKVSNPAAGGAISMSNGGNLTATNVVFQNNATYGYGGAIYGSNKTGKIQLTDCTFTGNESSLGGGAIEIEGGQLEISGTTFSQNKYVGPATGSNFGGGAILVKSGNPTISISNSTFSKNTSNWQAGAVYICSASTTVDSTITGCSFTENQSSHGGGAVLHNGSGKLVVRNTSFTTNQSTANNGGAIWTGRPLEVYNSTFTTNASHTLGGAIYTYQGNGILKAEDTTFTGNTNSSRGGAVYLEAATGHTVTRCTFTNNVTTDDGGAIFHGAGTLSVSDCSFTDNNARVSGHGEGGALYSKGTATIHNTSIIGNNSALNGAVWSNSSVIITGNTAIYNNTAADSKTADVYLSDSNKLTLNSLGSNAYINVATAADAQPGDFLTAGANLASGYLPVYYQNTATQIVYANGAFSATTATHRPHYACTCTMGTTGCDHGTNSPESWQAWESGTALPTAAGNYYLTKNITLVAATTISADVKICLNGFNIDLNQKNIQNSANLTIMNCKATLNSKKQLTSENGKIYNGNGTNMGGAIRSVGSNGSLHLMGVLFTDNKGYGADTRSGGALYLENGTTTIQSCKFTDNQAITNDANNKNRGVGGAISMYYNANVTVTDTVFNGNTAQLWGGAIMATNREATKNTSLVINGNTEFNNNTTPNTEHGSGSALYLFDFNDTYTLSVTLGGNTTVAGNAAAQSGAVLLRSSNPENPLQITLTENVKVYGNTGVDKDSANVFVSDDGTKVTLDAFGADANVNVSTHTDKDANAFLLAGAQLAAGTLPVYYQNTEKQVHYDGTAFSMATFDHKNHYACACVIGAAGCNHGMEPELVWTAWNSNDSLPTATGNYYLTQDVDLTRALKEGSVVQVTSGKTVRLCLNGKTITCDQNNAQEFSYFAWGSNVTIMNCRAELDSDKLLDAEKSVGGKIVGANNYRAGALRTYGNANLTLIGVELSGNRSTTSSYNLGGALLVEGGNVTVQYCRFADNYSNQMGGAILLNGHHADLKSVTIENTVFTGNESANYGGAIGIYTGANTNGFSLLVKDCVFEDNQAVYGGAVGVLRYSATPTAVDFRFDFENCRFTGNNADVYGGAIIVVGRADTKTALSINNCQLSENVANTGGAISMQDAQLTVGGSDTRISDNTASNSAGAVYLRNSAMTMTDGKIEQNTSLNGGAIMLFTVADAMQATLNLQGGTIANNRGNDGGGIFVGQYSALNQTGGSVEYNHCAKNGGGVYLGTGAVANLSGGQISYNTSDECGAGINASAAQIFLKGTTVSYNVAKNYGGGIRTYYGSYLKMESGLVDNNKSGRSGGGMALYGDADITGGKITNNSVDPSVSNNTKNLKGGGIFLFDSNGNPYDQRFIDLNISGGEISGNYAPESGGGIYMNGRHKVTMTGGVISNNHADVKGGGIIVDNVVHFRASKSLLRIIDGEISGNTAPNGGGIYSNLAAYLDLQGGTFTGNTATEAGGAMHLGRGTNAQLRNLTMTGNTAEKGAALYFMDDTILENLTVTGNEAGDGYSVYLERGDYDGESYVMGIIKMSGDMIVANNNGTKPDMFIGKKSQIIVNNAGMGANTNMNIALEDGVLTSTVLGAYNYTGGNRAYTLTAGDLSKTQIETITPAPITHANHVACICAMDAVGCTHGALAGVNWSATATMPTATGSYYLTQDVTLSGEITISGAVKICLNGYNINLNGYRIVNSGDLTIMNCKAVLTYGDRPSTSNGQIYGGKTSNDVGGAIKSNGTLTLLGVNFNDNKASAYSAGAIYVQSGSATIGSCKFFGNTAAKNGGAIYVEKGLTVQINGCVFADNKASTDGGAVYGYGCTLNMSNCTFQNNIANLNGGAIYLLGISGGNSAGLTLSDSEFSRNCAHGGGGAIYMLSGITTVDLTNCQFLHNICYGTDGGAISHNSGILNLNDCTFTKNWTTKGRGGAIYAIRTVNATNCMFDANDTQVAGASLYLAYSATLTDCTVQKSGSDSNVKRNSGVHYEPIEANTTLKIVGGKLSSNSISGNGAAIYMKGSSSDCTASLVLEKVNFQDNTAANGSGGAIYAASNIKKFEVTDCQFTNNRSTNEGGAISHNSGVLTVTGSTFSQNGAMDATNGKGGAIYGARQIDATECTFDGNTATAAGSVIYAGYTTNLTDCTVQNNLRNSALHYEPNTANTRLTITGGTFTGNTSNNGGAALSVHGAADTAATVTMSNVQFSNNTANGDGGAIHVATNLSANGFKATGCTFTGNKSAGNGGAISHHTGELTLTNCSFTGNETTSATSGNGGAINAIRKVVANNCTFDGNKATNSGAALYLGYESELNNCTVKNNSGKNGAVYVNCDSTSGLVTIKGGSITDNTASVRGGALYLAQRYMKLQGAPVITNNTVGGVKENVYLAEGTYLAMSSLAEGAKVGLTPADQSATVRVATSDGSYKTGMLFSDVDVKMVDPNTNGATTLNIVAMRMAQVGNANYTKLQDAVDAAKTDSTVTVTNDLTGTDTVLPATEAGQAVKLDLNGTDIDQNVHLSSQGTTTLYLADSSLAYDSNETTRVLKSAISNKVTVSRTHRVDNKRYVVLDAGRYYEIHRVQASITAKALRPTNNGIGFKVKFSAAKSIPESYLKGFGMTFTIKDGNGNVVKDAAGNPLEPKIDLQKVYNKEMVNGQELTVVISDFLTNNPELAEYTVVGTPFIQLSDGTNIDVTGTPVEISFKYMVEYANTNFGSLTRIQKLAIAQMMYRKPQFTTILKGWQTTNIAKFAEEEGLA